MAYKVIGVTANCGNSTIGNDATQQITKLLDQTADLVVINLQEANFYKIERQLRKLLSNKNIGLATSKFMTTITKPTEIFGRTGIGTIVLFNKSTISDVTLDDGETTKKVRGDNRNKGGLLSTFKIHTKKNETLSLRTISGHLDSNNEKRRCKDWANIIKNNAFDAKDWDDLVKKIPDIQVSGYDANTRDLWHSADKPPTNLWHKANGLAPPIAFMVQSPLGNHLYSQDNTYNSNPNSPIEQDKNRPKYAKAGSLDFVSVQNNSSPKVDAPSKKYFHESILTLLPPGSNTETERDHSAIVSAASELDKISDFEKVRNHISSQLAVCAPTLSAEIANLTESKENKTLLCKAHKMYLSPNGKLVKKLSQMDPTENEQNIAPWFQHDSLKSLCLDWSPLDTKELRSLRKEFGGWIFNWRKIAKFEKNLQECIKKIEQYESIAQQSVQAGNMTDELTKYLHEVQASAFKLHSNPKQPILKNFLDNFNSMHQSVQKASKIEKPSPNELPSAPHTPSQTSEHNKTASPITSAKSVLSESHQDAASPTSEQGLSPDSTPTSTPRL